MNLTFASSNVLKFEEIRSILSSRHISVEFARLELLEVQSDDLVKIAIAKAKDAYSVLKRPVFVEDDGLYIDALHGFPGPYSSFAFKKIGNKGILKLMEDSKSRAAKFIAVLAFHDGKTVSSFRGIANGTIAETEASDGWGYDPIFVPEGEVLTFGEIGNRKNLYSHRAKAVNEFAAQLQTKFSDQKIS